MRRYLNDNTTNHYETTDDYCTSPTEKITARKNKDSADKAADLIDCSDGSLHRCIISSGFKHIIEGWCSDDTAHDTVWYQKSHILSG